MVNWCPPNRDQDRSRIESPGMFFLYFSKFLFAVRIFKTNVSLFSLFLCRCLESTSRLIQGTALSKVQRKRWFVGKSGVERSSMAGSSGAEGREKRFYG